MRPLPLEEIKLRLAGLARRVNRSAPGKLTLRQVREGSPEHARIQESLGGDTVRDGDWDQAGDRWERDRSNRLSCTG